MTAPHLSRQIVVKGKHAYARVMVALSKEFPGRVPDNLVKIDRLKPNAETKKMPDQEMMERLEKGLDELEREIYGLLKAKKPVEDDLNDWSDTPIGSADGVADTDDDGDNGDDTYDHLDDDEDEEDPPNVH